MKMINFRFHCLDGKLMDGAYTIDPDEEDEDDEEEDD